MNKFCLFVHSSIYPSIQYIFLKSIEGSLIRRFLLTFPTRFVDKDRITWCIGVSFSTNAFIRRTISNRSKQVVHLISLLSLIYQTNSCRFLNIVRLVLTIFKWPCNKNLGQIRKTATHHFITFTQKKGWVLNNRRCFWRFVFRFTRNFLDSCKNL